MKVHILLLPAVFYLGFIARCLMTISAKRFLQRTFNKLGHY